MTTTLGHLQKSLQGLLGATQGVAHLLEELLRTTQDNNRLLREIKLRLPAGSDDRQLPPGAAADQGGDRAGGCDLAGAVSPPGRL